MNSKTAKLLNRAARSVAVVKTAKGGIDYSDPAKTLRDIKGIRKRVYENMKSSWVRTPRSERGALRRKYRDIALHAEAAIASGMTGKP